MLLNAAFLLLLGAQARQSTTPPPAALPAELVAYYTDYNFVNAFSTRFERRSLTSQRGRAAAEPDGRLRAVRDRLERLAGMVRGLDAGILYDRGAGSPLAERADLLEIRSHRVDETDGTAVVELDVINLVPLANGQLIAQFDQLNHDDEPLT